MRWIFSTKGTQIYQIYDPLWCTNRDREEVAGKKECHDGYVESRDGM